LKQPFEFKAFVRTGALACLALGFLQAFAACGQTVPVGVDDALASTGGSAGSGGSLALAGQVAAGGDGVGAGGDAGCTPTLCRGQKYQCGDCVDNDQDGGIDALDTACLGPCDDDETGLSTGLLNASAACRQDCYFDGDSGSGNDKCEWSHQCDKLSVAPDYPPSGEPRCAYDAQANGAECEALAQQSTACLDNCLPLVPNGCDCFGCCEVPGRSGQYHFLGAGRGAESCQLDQLDDPQTCPPCTPVPSCFNDCKKCEVCVGQEPDASCQATTCDDGLRACGPGIPCDLGFYCVTGCCVRAPVR
jgi:hypothetical protein